MQHTPEELKEMRLLAGMTFRSAAEATGIPKSTLWAVERGFAKLGRDDESAVVFTYSKQIHLRLCGAGKVFGGR